MQRAEGNLNHYTIAPGMRRRRLFELWKSRELMLVLAIRDVKARYKQTALGLGWVVLQPVLSSIVVTWVFGSLIGIASRVNGNYFSISFAGLVLWGFANSSLHKASLSLLNNSVLVTRIYVPRMLLPISAASSALIDFAFAFVVALVLLACGGVVWTPALVLAPLFAIGVLISTVAIGAPIAAISAYCRDIRHALPFLTQLWMFASPIAYPIDMVPSQWRLLYSVNPLAGMTSGFRSCVLGFPFQWDVILVSTASSLTLLLIGASVFHRLERRIPEVL